MPLLKIRNRNERPKQDQADLSKYGPGAGVGYDEVVIPRGPMRAEWVRQVPGVLDVVRLYRNPTGAASLRNMAIRSVIVNSSVLTSDTMECVPWEVGGRDVWRIMCREYGFFLFNFKNVWASVFRFMDWFRSSISLSRVIVWDTIELSTCCEPSNGNLF